jgi:thioester reductase-like protein
MDSLLDYLEYWAQLQPEKVLFEFRNGLGGVAARHTYRSMLAAVDGLALQLLGQPRLRYGDRVLLAHPCGLGMVVSLLACARAGLIPVPVALPQHKRDAAMRRLRAIAANCSAAAVLSDGTPLHRLPALLASHPETGGLAVLDGAADKFASSADGLADQRGAPAPALRHDRVTAANPVLFLQYTSGSTGRPRGVIVSHRNVIANCAATVEGVAVGVSWLPQHHDMGLIGYYLFPIVSGGTCYGMSPADFLRTPAAWLRLISQARATHTSAPDFGYAYCLRPGKVGDDELAGVDLGCLRVMMSGGETVRPDTMRRFHERFAAFGLKREACVAAYGLAEATLNVAQNGRGSLRLSRARLRAQCASLASAAEQGIEIASCGRPVPGLRVFILPAREPGEFTIRVSGADPPDRVSNEHTVATHNVRIGEICVQGDSVTAGYWDEPQPARTVLYTGDLGFEWKGELYVCGRRKELIIVGGANFYPDDLEAAVYASGAAVRPRRVCAFQDEQGQVVLLAEPLRASALPEPAVLANAVRVACALTPDLVQLVAPRSITLTTSGKLARAATRAAWAGGVLQILASYRLGENVASAPSGATNVPWRTALRALFARYGADDATSAALPLSGLGVDSLALVTLQLELEDLLRGCGSGSLAETLDTSVLQQVSLNGLLAALAPLDRADAQGAAAALAALKELKAALDSAVGARMQADIQLPCAAPSPAKFGGDLAHEIDSPCVYVPTSVDAPHARTAATRSGSAILLTGATGFFGPFLLHELLRQTKRNIVVLVRARDEHYAMERVDDALRRARLSASAPRARVRAVCGDLALPQLGLDEDRWNALAAATDEIFHNGACVNYVMTYDAMRGANVEGTRTMLALAQAGGRRRTVQLVSSTFIFGWSSHGVLLETDCNVAMRALDFGYAQTKWVAEQLALAARAQGLDVRIYRPSLISVSTRGAGDPDDVALRMLAFMIRHGVAVDTPNQLSILPADVIAQNIVGISRSAHGALDALHVTADRYYSMTELTQVIERDYRVRFHYFDIPHFIDELNRRCTPKDPVFPLLDFFNRSADKIAAMQLKRYSSLCYQQAKAQLNEPRADPSLVQTAGYLMLYLRESGWIGVEDTPVAF